MCCPEVLSKKNFKREGIVLLFANVMSISNLAAPVAADLVAAFLNQIPENDNATVISVKQDGAPPTSAVDGIQPKPQPRYDPGVAYILEFCTVLALREQESISLMGKQVFDATLGLLRDHSQWHSTTLAHAAFHSLSILRASYVRVHLTGWSCSVANDKQENGFVNVPFLLHSISSLPSKVLIRASDTILKGLSDCTNEPGPLRSEVMTSPDFWSVLRTLGANPKSASQVFAILEDGAVGSPPAIIADNYEAAVSLLNYFASSASPRSAIDVKEDNSGQKPGTAPELPEG